ncbi:putative G protein-coupled receptor 85, partial [Stegodyphus mimosarum]
MQEDVEFLERNATSKPAGRYSGPLTLFQFISLGLIVAIGSAGNSLVIYAFGRYLKIRRSPYMLMFGFVSLDLLRVLVCFPIIFITVVHPIQSDYGTELCQLIAFAHVFCLIGNNLSILGMAVDRYIDNKHRALYRRKCRGSVGTALLLIVWGMAFIFAFPTVYSVHPRQYRLEAQCTYPHHYFSKGADTLGLMVSLATAFVFTNVIYVKLFLFLRLRRRMRPIVYEPAVSENWGFYDPRGGISVRNRWLANSLSDTPIAVVSRSVFQSHTLPTNYELALWRSKKQKENEKLTKLCLAIHIIFSVMWLPYTIACFCFALIYER